MKRIIELKAKLISRNQEIKRLKKLLRQTKETNQQILDDYHNVIDCIKQELNTTKKALAKSLERKWYQFQEIKDKI